MFDYASPDREDNGVLSWRRHRRAAVESPDDRRVDKRRVPRRYEGPGVLFSSFRLDRLAASGMPHAGNGLRCRPQGKGRPNPKKQNGKKVVHLSTRGGSVPRKSAIAQPTLARQTLGPTVCY